MRTEVFAQLRGDSGTLTELAFCEVLFFFRTEDHNQVAVVFHIAPLRVTFRVVTSTTTSHLRHFELPVSIATRVAVG